MPDFAQAFGQLTLTKPKLSYDQQVMHIRHYLFDRPLTSRELADLSGLTTDQVWGRLKQDISMGRIEVREGMFHWVDQNDQPEVQAAIRLLRRCGYTVAKRRVKA